MEKNCKLGAETGVGKIVYELFLVFCVIWVFDIYFGFAFDCGWIVRGYLLFELGIVRTWNGAFDAVEKFQAKISMSYERKYSKIH